MPPYLLTYPIQLMYPRLKMTADPFACDRRLIEFCTSFLKESSTYRLERVEYLSPLRSPYRENNRVYAFHWTPREGRKMLAIVVLHGLGVQVLLLEKLVCRVLLRWGFDAVLFILPYHLERTPRGARSGSHFFSLDRQRSFDAFRQAVVDLRCLGDYLSRKGLSLAAWGTSLGGILLNTLMGVDDRYKVGISISAGGNINRMVWEGLMGRFVKVFLKSKGVREDHYQESLREFEDFLKRIREKGDIPEPKWEWWLLDPLTYAHLNRPRTILMFNGLLDMIVPRLSALELSSALEGARICWLPAGHFTMVLFTPYMISRGLRLFERYGVERRP